MAIKDLLVAYQGDDSSQNALKFALQMAGKYNAMVTGVHVLAAKHYDTRNNWIPESVRDVMGQAERDAAAQVEKSFREALENLGADRQHAWANVDGAPSLVLARMSRFFDILITGQFESAISHGGRALQPEELIQRSGKPMLIIPEAYEVRPFKEVAVVAWDGSRSAARALSDAMQILETKKKLYVVTVQGPMQRISPLRDHDIIEHLRRHDIDAELVSLEGDMAPGQAVIEFCQKVDPDVLVLGAFGRAKIGSISFGRTTRFILENQNVPVLMSH